MLSESFNQKLFACESKNSNFIQFEDDVSELMKIMQFELSKRNIKALIVGIVKE